MAGAGNPNSAEFTEAQTPLYDNAGTQFVAARAVNVKTDTSVTPNIVYGDMSVSGLTGMLDGQKATYRYAIQATAPYASATDWIVLRGSSSKTIRVTHIELSGAATAATEVIMLLKKHTIANTGGTSTNPTPLKHDSNDGNPTALILLYSVAPTIDASAIIFQPVRLTLAVAPAATANLVDRFILDYGNRPAEALVLRGVAQELAFQPGTIPSGGVYDVVIEWTEE